MKLSWPTAFVIVSVLAMMFGLVVLGHGETAATICLVLFVLFLMS